MRDPKRIPELLEAIAEQWADNPDLRLGQMLWQAAREVDAERNLMNVEDGQLLRGLELRKEKIARVKRERILGALNVYPPELEP